MTHVYTGTYSGTSVGETIAVVHSDGTFNAMLTETFTGTIRGSAPGTSTDSAVCSGPPFTCTFVTDHGAGGLKGVHAQLTLTHPSGQPVNYAGLVWFTTQHEDSSGDTSSSTTPAQATTTLGGSGQEDERAMTISWTGTSALTSTATTHDADGNTIVYGLFSSTQTGDLPGTAVGAGVTVIHPDDTLKAKSTGTFTGTVLGSSPGTAAFTVVRYGNATYQAGHIRLSGGTGGLAGIQGHGTTTLSHPSDMPATFTNTARIRFS